MKKTLSWILAVAMMMSVMSVAAFADEPEQTLAEKIEEASTAIEKEVEKASEAAAAAKEELDKISTTDANDQLLSGYEKDAETALTKTETEAAKVVDPTEPSSPVSDAAAAAQDAIDNIATATDKQAAINTAATEIDKVIDEVNKSVEAASEAVESAKDVIQAATEAASAANEAVDAANKAMKAAEDAETIYQDLLQAAEKDDSATYAELVEAENARTEAWQEYMAQRKLADDLQEAADKLEIDAQYSTSIAQGEVTKALSDAREAQGKVAGLLEAWMEAEAAMRTALDGTGNADLKDLEAQRKAARDAALAAYGSAREANLKAIEIYGKALEAIGLADDAAGLANALVDAVSDKNFEGQFDLAVAAAVEKAIDDQNRNMKGNASKNQNGNEIHIHAENNATLLNAKEVYIILSNGEKVKLSKDIISNKWVTTNSKYTIKVENGKGLPMLLLVDGNYYWIPCNEGNVKENGTVNSGKIQYKGELTSYKYKTPTGADLDGFADKLNPELSVSIDLGSLGGLTGRDPLTTTPTEATTPTPPVTTPTTPATTPFTPFMTTTTTDSTPDTSTPDTTPVAAGTVTIGDEAVPLAMPPADGITIMDEEVPLAGLPQSGGQSRKAGGAGVLLLGLAGLLGMLSKKKKESEE